MDTTAARGPVHRDGEGARLPLIRVLLPILLSIIVFASACQGEGIEESPATTTAPQTVPTFDAAKYGGSANYVVNPSFENGMKQWGPSTFSSVVRQTRRYHHDGKAAAELVAREAAPYGVAQSSVVGYPGQGQEFVLTAWVRAIGRPAVVHLVATESGGKAEPVNLIDKAFHVRTRWMRLSARGTVRDTGRTALSFSLGVTNSIAPGDRFVLDGVTLYREF